MSRVCQECFNEIQDDDDWNFVWRPRPGRLEPVHAKCNPERSKETRVLRLLDEDDSNSA